MASETDSLFIPFILGLSAGVSLEDPTNLPEEAQDQAAAAAARASRDRVILINPLTQTMTILEYVDGGGSSGLESFLGDLLARKNDQRPATKASIDGLPRVEIARGDENDGEQCVVCLEEWGDGDVAKEMPCKHRFHGGCIEEWLRISGCCPVCRYQMPVDDDDGQGNKSRGENEGERRRRREIWLSFGVRNVENRDSSSDHQEFEA